VHHSRDNSSKHPDCKVVTRAASERTDSATVRLSLPRKAVNKLDVTGGDTVLVIIGDDGVRIEPLDALSAS
jgi:hypothetical protein